MYLLSPGSNEYGFPPVDHATPEGLLAAGGDLSQERLLEAYRQGIFPWYSPGQPILWWSPDPRAVLYPEKIKVSRSLGKTLRRGQFVVTFDTRFRDIMHACAGPRANEKGTWITPEMVDAYSDLHAAGLAHSVEVWHEGELAGGLYGVALGRVFFGESMFTRVTDASKVGLVTLCRQLQAWGFGLIDCQVSSPHLLTLGAEEISRNRFRQELEVCLRYPDMRQHWQLDGDLACQ